MNEKSEKKTTFGEYKNMLEVLEEMVYVIIFSLV